MSDRKDDTTRTAKAPRPMVETTPFEEEEDAATTGARIGAAWDAAAGAVHHAAESEDLQNAVGFVKGLGATAWRYAGNHPFTVTYGTVGLVLAVLILTLGLWDTIVIAVFVMVGAMIGQIRDGDNGIVNFFRRLFGDRR